MTLQQISAVIQCDWFRVAGDGSGTVQYGKAVNTEQQGILMSWREEGDKQTCSYGSNSTATMRTSRPRERDPTPWSLVGGLCGTECSQRGSITLDELAVMQRSRLSVSLRSNQTRSGDLSG